MQQTIICAKWGTRYPALYVNTLWSMIKRNTHRDTRLICFTDDPSGIDPAVTTYPIPEINLPMPAFVLGWRKVSFWASKLEPLTGDVLFMDLDVVITGGIDDFFDFSPESTFCVIENWTQVGEDIGNTSVYRFRVGSHPYLYDKLNGNPQEILSKFPNSQTYISRTVQEKTFWPAAWCQSFKHTLLPRWPMNFIQPAPLPAGTKVVAFTGKPDPDEARDGVWQAKWYKKTYKHVRPTPWIKEHWR